MGADSSSHVGGGGLRVTGKELKLVVGGGSFTLRGGRPGRIAAGPASPRTCPCGGLPPRRTCFSEDITLKGPVSQKDLRPRRTCLPEVLCPQKASLPGQPSQSQKTCLTGDGPHRGPLFQQGRGRAVLGSTSSVLPDSFAKTVRLGVLLRRVGTLR